MNIDYRAICPKETYYAGILFRSRLEATWAVFFDQMKWRWEYEPFVIKNWFPDFIINEDSLIAVEVKPVFDLTDEITRKLNKAVPPRESENDTEVFVGGRRVCLLVLGAGIIHSENYKGIGWCRDESDWGLAVPGCWSGRESKKKGDGRVGFCHEYMSYHDWITGAYDGGHHGCDDWDDRVDTAWAYAKTFVRYQPREGDQ